MRSQVDPVWRHSQLNDDARLREVGGGHARVIEPEIPQSRDEPLGGLVRASLEEIARLREHPSELPASLDCGIWAPPSREVRATGVLGWLLRLTPVTIHENDPDAVSPPGAEHGAVRPNIDLDKAWEPLHFLLTGTALEGEEPACYLACGGEVCSRQSRWRRSIDTFRH